MMKLSNGHERAFLRRQEEELCTDIARRIARKTAEGEQIGEAFLRYRMIALDFRCLQPRYAVPPLPEEEKARFVERLVSATGKEESEAILAEFFERVMRSDNAGSLAHAMLPHFADKTKQRGFWNEMEQEIRAWLRIAISKGKKELLRIDDVEPFSADLMQALALEWLRSPKALHEFLTEIFKRWDEIDDKQSPWRRSILIHQIAKDCLTNDGKHDWVRILDHLEQVKAVPVLEDGKLMNSCLAGLRRMSSRECKEAGEAKGGPVLGGLL